MTKSCDKGGSKLLGGRDSIPTELLDTVNYCGAFIALVVATLNTYITTRPNPGYRMKVSAQRYAALMTPSLSFIEAPAIISTLQSREYESGSVHAPGEVARLAAFFDLYFITNALFVGCLIPSVKALLLVTLATILRRRIR